MKNKIMQLFSVVFVHVFFTELCFQAVSNSTLLGQETKFNFLKRKEVKL
jgi:hypothetical protein